MLTRNSFIISKEEKILLFLKLFGTFIDVSRTKLQLEAEKGSMPLGASFENLLIDSQALGFVSNGGKYNLTDSGKRILNNPNDRQLWKQAYVKVPLFKEYYENYGHDMNYTSFIRFVYSKYSVSRQYRKWLGMATRRFFKGFYEAELPPKLKQPKMYVRRLTKRQMNINTEILGTSSNQENTPNGLKSYIDDDTFELIGLLNKAKSKFTKEAIIKTLEKL